MIDMHTDKSTRDQKINDLKPHLPKALENLNDLCKKCINCYKNSNYADDDLRKTIFSKLYLLLVDFAIHCDLIIEEKHLNEIIKKWGLFNVSAAYLENFFKFAMRSLYSDSIELVEHLTASILKIQKGKTVTSYKPFVLMARDLVKQGIIDSLEQKFLKDWVKEQRNPRHRNYEDHYKGGEPIKYEFPHDFRKFEQLINIIQKITIHSFNEEVLFVGDQNPR
ncbi:hypothetical protein E3J79_04055 [Candidatus Dependentiae bacterium]|nr:MAG: hypothetical protein E3J79_04055 [Candidatus Dependentiae bacterium]